MTKRDTGGATNITTPSALLNAVITNAGSTDVFARGFYYGINPDPVTTEQMILSSDAGNAFPPWDPDLEAEFRSSTVDMPIMLLAEIWLGGLFHNLVRSTRSTQNLTSHLG